MGLYQGSKSLIPKFELNMEEITADEVQSAWDSYPPPCLTFSSPSAFSVSAENNGWDGTMEYSTDQSLWTPWSGIEVDAKKRGGTYSLYFRGTGNTKVTGSYSNKWTLTGSNIACTGNIESLLDYATVAAGNHPSMAANCYYSMFQDCTGLTSAPALPAMTLADSCYRQMFYGCTSLTAAPALPATKLAGNCYNSMFRVCTGLTAVPALSATKLADICYYYMFYGCTSLKLSATQTGSYTQAYRIPTSGTGTTASGALSSMFTNTGGTFTGTPEINTTYYLDESNTIV